MVPSNRVVDFFPAAGAIRCSAVSTSVVVFSKGYFIEVLLIIFATCTSMEILIEVNS